MSDGQRPWWASSTDGAGMSTDGAGMSTDGAGMSTDGAGMSTDDPVVAHRAARRGPGEQVDEDDAGGRGARAGSGPAFARPSRASEPPHGHADAICGVCPICVLARTLGDTHPELLGHLTEAARHLAAAARAMLDPSAHDEPGSDGVQRIDLD